MVVARSLVEVLDGRLRSVLSRPCSTRYDEMQEPSELL
jgi:hypothetical protein